MNGLAHVFCFAFGLLICVVVQAETPSEDRKAAEIPLVQVWAHEMQGTRDAGELDAITSDEGTSHPMIDAWQKIMWARFQNGEATGPAFVVRGKGKEALLNAHTGLDEMPSQEFPESADLSLVFYTRYLGSYVQIERIEQTNNTFVISYRFVAHRSRNMSFHFALIPLTKLQPGVYRVEMNQLPTITTQGSPEVLDVDPTNRICGDSSFTIEGGP